MKALYVVILFAVVAAGCRTRGPAFNLYTPPESDAAFTAVTLSNRVDAALLQSPTNLYRLGPGDVVEVESIGDAAGRASLTIGPDGKVYYSLLPGVSLWGLTIPEARTLLQQQMGKFARNMPELVINLRVAASQRVWLLGAVQSPGVYALATPMKLLDALAAAGGVPANHLDDTADLSHSFVLRNGKLLAVDFERLMKKGDMSQNLYLQPGDFVFLRPAEQPGVYVLGAVNGPTILPYSKELTLATAILRAGGTVKYAQNYRVAVVRGALTEPRIAETSYNAIVRGQARDIPLKPGDIVYVPFAPYRHIAQLAEEMLNQFVSTIAVNEGSALAGQKTPVQLSAPFGITPSR